MVIDKNGQKCVFISHIYGQEYQDFLQVSDETMQSSMVRFSPAEDTQEDDSDDIDSGSLTSALQAGHSQQCAFVHILPSLIITTPHVLFLLAYLIPLFVLCSEPLHCMPAVTNQHQTRRRPARLFSLIRSEEFSCHCWTCVPEMSALQK